MLYVVPHPLQRMHDVEHADVARLLEVRAAQFLGPEISEAVDIQAMIDGHNDHVSTASQVGSVGARRRAGSGGESAPVAPEHDRPFAAVFDGGCPDVEYETI